MLHTKKAVKVSMDFDSSWCRLGKGFQLSKLIGLTASSQKDRKKVEKGKKKWRRAATSEIIAKRQQKLWRRIKVETRREVG